MAPTSWFALCQSSQHARDRAPLLFVAGGVDHVVPPAANKSNVKLYRKSKSEAIVDYKEFPGRSHYTLGQDGWEEVANYALDWAEKNAGLSAVAGNAVPAEERDVAAPVATP